MVGKVKATNTGFPLATARIRTTEWSLLVSTKKGSLGDMMYVTEEMRIELVFWMQASEKLPLPITEGPANYCRN